jgi:hypothetical protein
LFYFLSGSGTYPYSLKRLDPGPLLVNAATGPKHWSSEVVVKSMNKTLPIPLIKGTVQYHDLLWKQALAIRGTSFFVVAVRGIHTAVYHAPRLVYQGPLYCTHLSAKFGKKEKSSPQQFYIESSLFAAP